jgi:hypothetical protein
MDLPMAPALGLYLGEVFFDGYNAKQAKEVANDKRLAAMRAEKKVAAPAVPSAPVVTEEGRWSSDKSLRCLNLPTPMLSTL